MAKKSHYDLCNVGTELHKNFIFLIRPLCGEFYKRAAEDIIHFCTTE